MKTKDKKNDDSMRIIKAVCLTVLGSLTLIGIFFGKQGLIIFGVIILMLIALIISSL